MTPLAVDDSATFRRPGADPDAPLLLVLHGYGASEGDLLALLPHLGHDGDAAFLRAPLALGPGQWAWFPITTIGSPDVTAVQAAAEAVLAWLAEHADGRDVVALGFSQGSTVALQVARTEPGRLAALVVLSGFVMPAAQAGDAALAALAPPAFFGHGTADAIIPPPVTALTSDWLARHTSVTERSYPGLPHGVSGEELVDVREFLTGLDAR
ncbi:hypothetical protein C8046_05160 [Serinibacter arcticus]|uniref:Phospholipase/carboxylesterase/thioesterase domain-containing protein n=1 Tax=Serinibacter arcticus TaxID=1655435 RepID=A0A2U1ZT38_9MICO|nr:alpha/beta fold hydrolase [Serinibacter arcticus]PWD50147.1 hypothetical protein C8046_05160 [Serinibacter arcticus]